MIEVLFFTAVIMLMAAMPKHSLDKELTAVDYWLVSGAITILVGILVALNA